MRGLRCGLFVGCVVLGLAGGASAALAGQEPASSSAPSTASAGKPKTPDAGVLSGDTLPEEHAFGDWGGLRTRLDDKGVKYDLSYESETAAVVGGGLKRGIDYAHSINLKLDLDLEKLAHAKGLSLHYAVVERAGRSASADFAGDSLAAVQEIYGGGGDVLAHTSYVYGEGKWANGAIDLEAGRLDANQDFAASPLYCEFMTLAACPAPRSLSIQNAFTVFPNSTWGGRLKLQARKDLALQAGAYQVRPQQGGRAGLDWGADDTTGALLPVEIDWTPRFGRRQLVGHYKAGAVYDTSAYPGFAADPSRAAEHSGRASWYLLADQMLLRTGPNGTDGIILEGGYTHADPRDAVISNLEFIGLLASGVIPGRPADSIGIQVASLKVSGDLAAVQRGEAAAGLALTPGITDTLPPLGVQGRETVIEGRYDIRIRSGLHAMPDVQYVIHPDADRMVPNATVVGLRLTLDL